MSHHIYNTRAIVLSYRERGERDKVFSLLTKDVGSVKALAQGIRRESSKLGGVLLEYALVNISLVKGKNSWRITTASLERDIYGGIRGKKECVKSLARITALLDRLIKGEEKHKELFKTVESASIFLAEAGLEGDACQGFEIIAVLRILYHLGYMSSSDVKAELLESSFSRELVADALEDKKRLISLINLGLRESGLS